MYKVQIFKRSLSGFESEKEALFLCTSKDFSTLYLGATLGTFVSGPIALVREKA